VAKHHRKQNETEAGNDYPHICSSESRKGTKKGEARNRTTLDIGKDLKKKSTTAF
jgi:hypothetical protein